MSKTTMEEVAKPPGTSPVRRSPARGEGTVT